MNHEAEKRKISNIHHYRKWILRMGIVSLILICGVLSSIYGFKQLQYRYYLNLWMQEHQGNYVVYYRYGEHIDKDTFQQYLHFDPISADEIWDTARECLRNFFCKIQYRPQEYLPDYIEFGSFPNRRIETANYFDCSETEEPTIIPDCIRLFG